jgi:TPR repeat protein
MNKRKIYLLLFISVFLVIGGIVMSQPNDEVKAINPSALLKISDGKLEELSIMAIRGDGEAAKTISRHYSIGLNDESLGLYWFTIGAENDHASSQWNLSYRLTYSEKLNTRGIFWCIQAAKKREEYAINHLRRLNISPDIQLFDEMTYTNTDGNLSEVEISLSKENAFKGSGKSALFLSNYYGAINDNQSMEYWYRIGAQNGEPECQYRYGQILKKRREYTTVKGVVFGLTKRLKMALLTEQLENKSYGKSIPRCLEPFFAVVF